MPIKEVTDVGSARTEMNKSSRQKRGLKRKCVSPSLEDQTTDLRLALKVQGPAFMKKPARKDTKKRPPKNGDSSKSSAIPRRSSRIARPRPPRFEDFAVLSTVGKGGFGSVFLVRPNENASGNNLALDANGVYALKAIRKYRLLNHPTELRHTREERRVLGSFEAGGGKSGGSDRHDHPFVVRFLATFSSDTRVFFLTEFLAGGELFALLSDKGRLDEGDTRFYLAEITLALEFLHRNDILYRDLKPENVMLDRGGHIKLIDFGLARGRVHTHAPMRMTMCGTREYMAPEVSGGYPYNREADWWTMGALAYEMMTGTFPYKAGDYETPVEYPTNIFSQLATRFISRLMTIEPQSRLGSHSLGGALSVKRTAFFTSFLAWNDVYLRKLKPPFIPSLEDIDDLRYFDRSFTDSPARLSTVSAQHKREVLAKCVGDDPFIGFDFVNPEFLKHY